MAGKKQTNKAWALKGRDKEIAHLRDRRKLTWLEIAKLLGCTPEGARYRYNKFAKEQKGE